MKVIREKTAWYPAFHLGAWPQAIECTLAIVEANDKRYLKTPFAFLNAYDDEDIERQIGRGYYATQEECAAYLAQEYPWAELASPIMEALASACRDRDTIIGGSRVADKIGVNTDDVFKIARGHKRYTRKAVRQAVEALGK